GRGRRDGREPPARLSPQYPIPSHPRLICRRTCRCVNLRVGHWSDCLKRRHWLALILFVAAAALLSLWLARAFLVARYARAYFRDHGVDAAVNIGALGLS